MMIVLAALGAVLAATVQATAGLGFALVLTPVLFLEMAPAGAIVTATLLGILLNLLVLFAELRRPAPVWTEILPVLAAAIPGAACGLVLLASLSRPVLQMIVGAVVILAGLLRTRTPVRRRRSGARSRLALGYTVGALFLRLPAARYERLLLLVILAAGTTSLVAGATSL